MVLNIVCVVAENGASANEFQNQKWKRGSKILIKRKETIDPDEAAAQQYWSDRNT